MSYPEPVVGVIIVNRRGEVLLIKSPKWKGAYVVPGGHIEIGETMKDAVRREVREEVGLKVRNIRSIATYEGVFPKNFKYKKHFIYLHFLCDAASEKIKFDPREVISCEWVSFSKALKMPIVDRLKTSLALAAKLSRHNNKSRKPE